MRILTLALCGVLAAASAARAETPAPAPQEGGRYTMTPTEGGFLRLDTQTGAVSFCAVKDGQSLCRAGDDERAALEAQVSRLTRENAELKNRLAENPALSPSVQPRSSPSVPSEEEFERTLSFAERFLRRMMRILREEAPPDKT